jgi:hypothetical protein
MVSFNEEGMPLLRSAISDWKKARAAGTTAVTSEDEN